MNAMLIDPINKTVELIDTVKTTVEDAIDKEIGKVYLKNGAIISFGGNLSQPGWTISGYSFVLHGRALLIGKLEPEEEIQFL